MPTDAEARSTATHQELWRGIWNLSRCGSSHMSDSLRSRPSAPEVFVSCPPLARRANRWVLGRQPKKAPDH